MGATRHALARILNARSVSIRQRLGSRDEASSDGDDQMAFGDASDAVATLVARISAFQNGLDADHELAMAVPGHAPVRIDVIEFTTGDLVTLRGVTPAGERAEIVHHISQTNLMLVARQKQGPRARRIDFQFTKPALAPGEALGPSRRR